MTRKQVYGKRSHAFANTKIFDSPRKAEPIVDVLEIAEELEGLSVNDKHVDTKNHHSRAALEPIESNIQTKLKAKSQKVSKKEVVESRKEEDPKQIETPQPKAELRSDSVLEQREDQQEVPEPVEKTTILSSSESPSENEEDTSPKELDVYEQHTASLLQLSSRPLTSFDTWSDQLSSHFSIRKIAEASFGEVYRLSLLQEHAKLPKADESVLKIISLKPPPATLKGKKLSKAAKTKLEGMSDPEDVFSEVRLLQRMTTIPGFTNFRDMTILRGRPGQGFIDAWKGWNENQSYNGKERSVFPDPSKKASYGEDQLWAVIEMQDAGTDLENTKVDNVWLIWDIFWNVVLSIGKGEEGAKFEHRDLHLGNICVSKRDGSKDLDQLDEAHIDLGKKLGFTGAVTTIIDYTLSRAEMTAETEEAESDIAYLDLEKDQAVFEGDADVDYQYEIYRHMRSAMYLDDPLADMYERWEEAEASQRTWRGYHPQTNLVWLHFVLRQLSEHVYWPSLEKRPEKESAAYTRSVELESALQKVSDLLEPEQLPGSGLRSAADLVALALNEKWLDVEDVLGGSSKNRSSTKRVRKTKKRAL
ncbi:hypothetical protein MBLNU457_1457t1 [Dothideomycetes sp. NU457]